MSEPPPDTRIEVTDPEAAVEALGDLGNLDREVAVTLVLDTKHRLIERAVTSVGSVDHTFMVPRDVYRDALLLNAAAIVVAHNHPSGDAEPSPDDLRVTRRLVEAGTLLGVELLDHIVVGRDGRTTSLNRKGLM